ncbi:hypothetical protein GCM10009410_03700 [Shewanella ulleungensis]|uniref:Protein kinase domain-containing protein n=1 Tax=Shewanella ulleungensis TaxID=2282699 RepID=A0ABQ2QC85_9GAMM|nr:hypothetical protein GCM10009410_03700 [Shewanella ulleungensis]
MLSFYHKLTDISLDALPQNDRTAAFKWALSHLHLKAEALTRLTLLSEQDDILCDAALCEACLLDPAFHHTKAKSLLGLKRIVQQQAANLLSARAAHALALLYSWQSALEDAFPYALQAMEQYQRAYQLNGQAFVADTLGMLCQRSGSIERALLYFTRSLTLKQRINDTQGLALTLGNLARLCFQLGRFDQARGFLWDDINLLAEHDTAQLAVLYNLMARIELADDHTDEAIDWLTRAIAMDEHNSSHLFFCYKDLTLTYIARGERHTAESWLAKASSIQPRTSAYHSLSLQLIRAYLLQPSCADTESFYQEAFAKLSEHDMPEIEIELRIIRAEQAYTQQNFSEARDQLLLAKKRTVASSQLRFLGRIFRNMMEWDLTESLPEEVASVITPDLKQNPDYILRKSLGEGGFGVVSMAWDTHREKNVAIKQFKGSMQLSVIEQRQLWAQARREFETAASIKSIMIARPLAIGHDNVGVPYVVHEFIEGQKLSEFMQSVKDPDTIQYYIRQIAIALEFIHAANIIHRDIKPDNIIIRSNGVPVIIDLGIALLKGKHTEDSIAGTPNYMPPEQTRHTRLDFSADLYALGCIWYHWLSGKRPTVASDRNSSSLFQRAKRKLTGLKPGIVINEEYLPLKNKGTLKRMLAIEPSQRFASVQELLHSFDISSESA